MRRLASLLLVLAAAAGPALLAGGCRSLSSDEHQLVLAYLENAAQYYDNGHHLRAYQQWGKALELDPDEERAQLGQAMALYQLGREDSQAGVGNLVEAEKRLDALRGGAIGEQSWKAEIGYALVQERWAELYQRATDVLAYAGANEAATEALAARVADAKAELPKRVRAAETAFRRVLQDPKTEPNFKLSCWLGLARITSIRGDFEESLAWCRRYEEQVTQSVEFWSKQDPSYAGKLFGARLQEAELRDVMGNTLFKLGRFQEAEAQLDRLVELQPARAAAYLNRAIVRETRGAWDLARSDFRTFLETTDLPPESPVVLEAEKRRLLCEERMATEDQGTDRGLPSEPR